MEEKDPLAVDSLEKETLDGLKWFTYVSSLLSNEEREQLRLVLLNSIDTFVLEDQNICLTKSSTQLPKPIKSPTMAPKTC